MPRPQLVSTSASTPDGKYRFLIEVSSDGAVGCTAYLRNVCVSPYPSVRSVRAADRVMYVSITCGVLRLRAIIQNAPAWAPVAAARFAATQCALRALPAL